MQWKTTNSNERLINAVESAGIPTDGKTRNPGEEKEELHGKAIAFTVYWENRWREEPGNLELATDRIVEKRNWWMLISAQCKTKHWERTA